MKINHHTHLYNNIIFKQSGFLLSLEIRSFNE